MHKITIIIGTIILFLASVKGLSCPCQMQADKCPDQKPLNCKGDISTDACGCCKVCAKVENEKCRGPFWINGRCSSGLICLLLNFDFNADGICKIARLRNLGEPCGDVEQQGQCKKNLKCSGQKYQTGICVSR